MYTSRHVSVLISALTHISEVEHVQTPHTHPYMFIHLDLHCVWSPSSMKGSKQTPMVQVTNKLSDLVTPGSGISRRTKT